ncbi:TonB-dependent receptor [Parasphingorhabdus litoris]|uniref:TonB-dependent receptor n=1 Tax=Parasphingorhabdus litoris TaxID=394733 RepID=A0ABN1AX05_9SPHN|nr:TonB-dependent receptor [Parasphingorhabdus litoris]
MKMKYLLAASVVSLSTAGLMATPAAAQQITSGIEGQVRDDAGNPISGASVVITDTRTGQERTATTSGNGQFRSASLVPGGPYTITATAPNFEGQTVEDVFINLQGNTQFTFELASGGSEDIIVVTGTRANVTQLAVGPGQSFGVETLEAFPSISRDIRDIIRIDPRVSLDRANEVDRISCLGGNDRSNTFTVDGIVQADTFGLNGTPFAARNALPLPFDAIRETSVEFAPFDVEYSDFTGCAVNVVTKSGQNQFHGSAFFTFRDEGLRGDTAGGESFVPAAFQEKRWGATLSGPIIPDRLFFFAGYEETDLGDSNDFGPAGSGFPNEAEFVTQAQFDQFSQIAQNVYGIDVGGYPRALPESSVRYFGRLDAYITDDHRLEATYQRLEETNVESDFGGQNLTGLNSFEDEGTISDYYSIRLYSDWSDKVSTELRLSRSEVGDVQGPVGGGEAQSDNPVVRLAVGVVGPTENGVLSTGPGIFRSANQLDQTVDQAKFQMKISAGDHNIKLGAELNDLEVFNLFAINATGTIYFRNLTDFQNGVVAAGGSSGVFGDIADNLQRDPPAPGERDRRLGGATIRSTPSGDINEAAALFSRQIYSFYAQDEWQATDQLNVTAGLRVQIYDGDAPRANPSFLQRFGFTNSNPFSKIDPVILPRFAATYDFDNDGFFRSTSVTGGIGWFSGGDPVVFFSNAFSNNGFSSVDGSTLSGECAGLVNPDGSFNVLDASGQFTGFPQCAVQAASARAAAGGGDVQSTDPDFDIPTVFRANLGLSTQFGTDGGFFSDWNLNLDYIYSRFNDPLNFVDLVQVPDITEGLNGFTVDGRPIYQAINILTPGCNAELQGTGGTPPTYSNVTAECFLDPDGTSVGVDDFIQLTNGRSYDSHTFSLALSKRFNEGIFTENGSVSINFGYAFTDSNNYRNVGSSTATSNFDVTAAFDRQNPATSTSNFETRHNFTFATNFEEQFIDGFDTQLAMFFTARSGRPYSLTFDGGGVFADGSSGSDNALLYIPTGTDDPNIAQPIFDATTGDRIGGSDLTAVQSLIDYVNGTNCGFTAGQSIRRNTCRNDWTFDMDMRLSQEIPGPGRLFGVEDKIELFADFDNVLNLIDGEWNESRSRGDLVDVVDGDVDGQGRYVIEGFNPDDDNDVTVSSSAWRIQFGIRYEF